MTTIINLTPHPILVAGFDPISPSGQLARVSVTRQPAGDINGIPVYVPVFGDVEGLPAPASDTVFIVSGLVRTHPAVAGRTDVVSTGQLIRDDGGNVVGCDGLDANLKGGAA